MSQDINEQIQDRLTGGAAITSADLAEFNRPEGTEKPNPIDSIAQTTTAKVPEEVTEDNLLDQAGKVSEYQALLDRDMEDDLSDLTSTDMDLSEEDIEITPEDKAVFIECLITGARFSLKFPVFGGRSYVVIQNRTVSETEAIYAELGRAIGACDDVNGISPMEYQSRVRRGILRMQVINFDGKDYPRVGDNLNPTIFAEDGVQKVKRAPWADEADTFFGECADGLSTILYNSVLKFEKKYWTLVKYSHDQDFWAPEDSSLA